MMPDEIEDILALTSTSGWRAVMKIMDEVYNQIAGEVLSTPLPRNPLEAQSAIFEKRANADGARKLAEGLKRRLSTLKEKHDADRR